MATGENGTQLEGTWKRYRMADQVDAAVQRVERPVLAAPTYAASADPRRVELWNVDQGQLSGCDPIDRGRTRPVAVHKAQKLIE